MGLIESICGIIRKKEFGKTFEEESELSFVEKVFDAHGNCETLFEEFHGPAEIPSNRTELYALYGRAPKEKKHLAFPKCRMTTVKKLPGNWNNGSGKLHVAEYVAPYLQEALRRVDTVAGLVEVDRMGSYCHRHIRHDESRPLSYHSWGAAIDIDPHKNKSKYRAKTWSDNMKCGPIPPPFSKEWMELWPNGVSYGMVRIFKSCGFTWGGDWGHGDWESCVQEFGVGYESPSVGQCVRDWKKVSYTDPMHFQLVGR